MKMFYSGNEDTVSITVSTAQSQALRNLVNFDVQFLGLQAIACMDAGAIAESRLFVRLLATIAESQRFITSIELRDARDLLPRVSAELSSLQLKNIELQRSLDEQNAALHTRNVLLDEMRAELARVQKHCKMLLKQRRALKRRIAEDARFLAGVKPVRVRKR